jgi:hypothetical protein
MTRNLSFLFQHDNALARKPFQKAIRRGQSDNAATDDNEIVWLRHVDMALACVCGNGIIEHGLLLAAKARKWQNIPTSTFAMH